MNEAPVSFNVKAISPGGFDCMLTIRGEDSADLMGRALRALDWLADQGFQAAYAGPVAAPVQEAAAAAGNGSVQGPVCPVHQVAMKASKFGGWFCPQQIAPDDGTGRPVYCKQRIGE